MIYMGIIILLLISLTVVYTTYLRDRHNEWCLYCSIGYSRGNIYCAVMRELLFTFGSAFILGGVISILAAILLITQVGGVNNSQRNQEQYNNSHVNQLCGVCNYINHLLLQKFFSPLHIHNRINA